jgi:hypothetical protein
MKTFSLKRLHEFAILFVSCLLLSFVAGCGDGARTYSEPPTEATGEELEALETAGDGEVD